MSRGLTKAVSTAAGIVAGLTLVLFRPHPLFAACEALRRRPFGRVRVTDAAPAIAIIVCTRDRVESLIAHLPSIVEAAAASGLDTEIIVVDNGSTDGTSDEVVRGFPSIRLVRENTPGISTARNTGVRTARAPVVLFTDDDVEVPRDWVSSLVRAARRRRRRYRRGRHPSA